MSLRNSKSARSIAERRSGFVCVRLAGIRFLGIGLDAIERTLLLCGEPVGEPIVGHRPFVMNTEDEIRQAVRDYRSGRMGHLQ